VFGFVGIEANVHITLGTPHEDEELTRLERRAAQVARRIADAGLAVCGVGIWQLNLISPVASAKSLEYYNRSLDLCRLLRCPVLYHGAGDLEKVPAYEKVKRYIDTAHDLIARTVKAGVWPSLYCADIANFAWDPAYWDSIFTALPELGLKYDPSHLYHADKPYLSPLANFLQKFPRRLAHVHFKDVLKVPGSKPPVVEPPVGFGQIAWPQILALLLEAKYDRFVSLEPRGPWANDSSLRYTGLRMSRRWLTQFDPIERLAPGSQSHQPNVADSDVLRPLAGGAS
jgi:sugar phosphate isomerase/epimerase